MLNFDAHVKMTARHVCENRFSCGTVKAAFTRAQCALLCAKQMTSKRGCVSQCSLDRCVKILLFQWDCCAPSQTKTRRIMGCALYTRDCAFYTGDHGMKHRTRVTTVQTTELAGSTAAAPPPTLFAPYGSSNHTHSCISIHL